MYTSKRIAISLAYVLSKGVPIKQVRDTVLHEVAHAIAGNRAGHGPEWKEVAKRIGCSATRCHDMTRAIVVHSRIIASGLGSTRKLPIHVKFS
jgi:predicted SprT family Zn-dependent metalloprotease